MPDEPAGNDVAAQAQVAGADIMAQLDKLTQQPAAGESALAVESPEEYAKRMQAAAREAMKEIDAIVAGYVAQTRTEQSAEDSSAAAAEIAAQEKIEALKKSIGAQ